MREPGSSHLSWAGSGLRVCGRVSSTMHFWDMASGERDSYSRLWRGNNRYCLPSGHLHQAIRTQASGRTRRRAMGICRVRWRQLQGLFEGMDIALTTYWPSFLLLAMFFGILWILGEWWLYVLSIVGYLSLAIGSMTVRSLMLSRQNKKLLRARSAI